MTDQDGRRTPEENQREAERSALRNVRAALDTIGKHEGRYRQREVLVGLVTILLIVSLILVLTRAGLGKRQEDPARSGQIASLQYASQVEARIKAQVIIPRGVPDTARAVVELTLSKAGVVAGSKISASSGISAYDEAVLRAVSRAEPFPPIPASASLDASQRLQLQMQISAKDFR